VSVSGIEETRFKDIDHYVELIDPDMTFGDVDREIANVERIERLGDYTFGMNDQEPARFRV
jgi:hypothetical protein